MLGKWAGQGIEPSPRTAVLTDCGHTEPSLDAACRLSMLPTQRLNPTTGRRGLSVHGPGRDEMTALSGEHAVRGWTLPGLLRDWLPEVRVWKTLSLTLDTKREGSSETIRGTRNEDPPWLPRDDGRSGHSDTEPGNLRSSVRTAAEEEKTPCVLRYGVEWFINGDSQAG